MRSYGHPLDDIRPYDLQKPLHRPWGAVLPTSGVSIGYIPVLSKPGVRNKWLPSTVPCSVIVTIGAIAMTALFVMAFVGLPITVLTLSGVVLSGLLIYGMVGFLLRQYASVRGSIHVEEHRVFLIRLLDRLYVARDMHLIGDSQVLELHDKLYEFLLCPTSHSIIKDQQEILVIEKQFNETLEGLKVEYQSSDDHVRQVHSWQHTAPVYNPR